MTKQIMRPERMDILKMVQRELHEQGREDVKVEVAFVVNFDAGDPVIVNTIVDPHEPFPRWKCKQFVKSIIERLKELEAKQMGGFLQQAETLTASQGTGVSTSLAQTQAIAPVIL